MRVLENSTESSLKTLGMPFDNILKGVMLFSRLIYNWNDMTVKINNFFILFYFYKC